MNENDTSKFIFLLFKEIKKMVYKIIRKADFDRTYSGIVTEVLDSNKYKVKIYTSEYIVKSRWVHNIGDVVYVLCMQSNFNNLIIIY